jgi:16S rRNA (cytidine1402-2'-O)-methyltransferase
MVFFIATPIGNLEDITLRAIKTLRKINIIICEDTRQTSKLLNKYNIKNKKLIPYNDFNKLALLDDLVNQAKHNDLAFVSDAGMPIISDTGYKFLNELIINKIKYTVLPGPTASLTALSLSGLKPDKFLFLGFLPKSKNKIITLLETYKNTPASIIIYENKNRLLNTLKIIKEVFGNKKVAVIREITKIYEEVISDYVEEIINILETRLLKGEIVTIIENYDIKKIDNEIEKKIFELKKLNLSSKEIKNIIQIFTGNKISYKFLD